MHLIMASHTFSWHNHRTCFDQVTWQQAVLFSCCSCILCHGYQAIKLSCLLEEETLQVETTSSVMLTSSPRSTLSCSDTWVSPADISRAWVRGRMTQLHPANTVEYQTCALKYRFLGGGFGIYAGLSHCKLLGLGTACYITETFPWEYFPRFFF